MRHKLRVIEFRIRKKWQALAVQNTVGVSEIWRLLTLAMHILLAIILIPRARPYLPTCLTQIHSTKGSTQGVVGEHDFKSEYSRVHISLSVTLRILQNNILVALKHSIYHSSCTPLKELHFWPHRERRALPIPGISRFGLEGESALSRTSTHRQTSWHEPWTRTADSRNNLEG
jgi:hypothetical protein